MLAARAADPAGWAMRDADVAAAFAAAQENPDDPALARQATEQRLALQREMGIEQPRLLSEEERDEIAGQLAQAAPADRPALIADLRGRYGPHAGMLSAELAGEVDANTALLIAHADMPHLPRLIAQGMEKSAKDGPANLKMARPEDVGLLPALPIIAKGEQGGRKLDMAAMKPGQHYRTADGDVMLYDGEALLPMNVVGADDFETEFLTSHTELEDDETGVTGELPKEELASKILALAPRPTSRKEYSAHGALEDMLLIMGGKKPFRKHADPSVMAKIATFQRETPEGQERMLEEQVELFRQLYPLEIKEIEGLRPLPGPKPAASVEVTPEGDGEDAAGSAEPERVKRGYDPGAEQQADIERLRSEIGGLEKSIGPEGSNTRERRSMARDRERAINEKKEEIAKLEEEASRIRADDSNARNVFTGVDENGVPFVQSPTGRRTRNDPAAELQGEIDGLSAEIERLENSLGPESSETPGRRGVSRNRRGKLGEKKSELRKLEEEAARLRSAGVEKHWEWAKKKTWPLPQFWDESIDEPKLVPGLIYETRDGLLFQLDKDGETFQEVVRDENGAHRRVVEQPPLQLKEQNGNARRPGTILEDAAALAEQAGKGFTEADAVAAAVWNADRLRRNLEKRRQFNPQDKGEYASNLVRLYDKALVDIQDAVEELNRAVIPETHDMDSMVERAGLPGRAGNAASQFARGAAGGVASVGTFVAAVTTPDDRRALALFDLIDDDAKIWELYRSKKINQSDTRVVQLVNKYFYNTANRDQIRASAGTFDPADSLFYQKTVAFQNAVEDAARTNPRFDDEFFATVLPKALGMVAVKGSLVAALGAAGITGTLAAATVGLITESGNRFRTALEEGKSIDEAYQQFGIGAVVGLADGIPVAKFLTNADKATGGAITGILKEAAAKGTEGAVQTIVAEIARELLDRDIAEYDAETKQYTLVDTEENKDLTKQLGAQFSAEALVELVTALVVGK